MADKFFTNVPPGEQPSDQALLSALEKLKAGAADVAARAEKANEQQKALIEQIGSEGMRAGARQREAW